MTQPPNSDVEKVADVNEETLRAAFKKWLFATNSGQSQRDIFYAGYRAALQPSGGDAVAAAELQRAHDAAVEALGAEHPHMKALQPGIAWSINHFRTNTPTPQEASMTQQQPEKGR